MKKKDDEVIDRKKMLHSEMMDRGIVMEKKSRKSRDRTKKQPKEHHERQSRDKTRSKSRSSKHLSRSKTREKSASVVTFSNIHESKTFTEIDEKTQRSIEDSCSSGVQSGSNTSDLDSLNSPKATARMKKVHKIKTSSDSDSMDSDKFKESLRLKALERKQRSMENKVEEQEKKLADFAAKLSARKTKLEELHARLKSRKATLKEREEKLKHFEAQIAEREGKW